MTRAEIMSRVTVAKDGCWLWMHKQTKHRHDYGRIKIAKGKVIMAHRAVYESLAGKIPKGKILCHKCDNPRCVNPDHIFIGTHLDNCHDCLSKGRRQAVKGEAHYAARLNSEQVLEIYRDRSGNSQFVLAAKYGCSQRNISAIKRGVTWKHITLRSDEEMK